MIRFPLIPTIIVGLCIAAMIALGVWQLVDRLPQKQAYLAQLAANPARPEIAFPRFAIDPNLLFRRARGFCLEPVSVRREGAGKYGYRIIAVCRTGADGPGMIVQLGTTRDLNAPIRWKGGEVAGFISHAPDSRSLIQSLFDRRPHILMLVATTPPPGLSPNSGPDLSAVPNNHLAYGVQWFLFAAIAGVIYGLALRRREKKPG